MSKPPAPTSDPKVSPAPPLDDGGPAFPERGNNSPGCYSADRPGMKLRDYFAAKAMQSMTAGPGARMVADRDERYDETNWAQVVASNAYAMADAMIAARKGQSGGAA
ncbi:MAG TPA: hypothetical protein VFF65_03205 [Phycisphaerales bacterium]|nr:hypothetical protein [Phycisphaerales bacterium]